METALSFLMGGEFLKTDILIFVLFAACFVSSVGADWRAAVSGGRSRRERWSRWEWTSNTLGLVFTGAVTHLIGRDDPYFALSIRAVFWLVLVPLWAFGFWRQIKIRRDQPV